jgi:hypothetical protein
MNRQKAFGWAPNSFARQQRHFPAIVDSCEFVGGQIFHGKPRTGQPVTFVICFAR